MAAPVHAVRLGRITGSVWENPGDHGTWFSITVSRMYWGKDQKWHRAQSYGRDDLPVVMEVAHQCWLWVLSQTPSEVLPLDSTLDSDPEDRNDRR